MSGNSSNKIKEAIFLLLKNSVTDSQIIEKATNAEGILKFSRKEWKDLLNDNKYDYLIDVLYNLTSEFQIFEEKLKDSDQKLKDSDQKLKETAEELEFVRFWEAGLNEFDADRSSLGKSKSSNRELHLPQKVARYYGFDINNNSKLKDSNCCMVQHECNKEDKITAHHIAPRGPLDVDDGTLKLKYEIWMKKRFGRKFNVDNYSNVLLLCDTVGDAFDAHLIEILPVNPLNNVLPLEIKSIQILIDESFKQEEKSFISDNTESFQQEEKSSVLDNAGLSKREQKEAKLKLLKQKAVEFHGLKLYWPNNDSVPYVRALVFHAATGFKKIKQLTYNTFKDKFEPFLRLSWELTKDESNDMLENENENENENND